MMKMRRNLNLYLWMISYAFFAYTAFRVSIVEQGRSFYEFLYGNLFNPQKFLFDITIFFTFFLYTVKKPFNSLFFVSRCKSTYLSHVIFYGLKICFLYIIYTIILFYGIPYVIKGYFYFDISLLMSFWNLFAFLLSTYMIYILVLLISEKQMVAVLSGSVINIAILMIHFFLSTTGSVAGKVFEAFLMSSYTGISLLVFVVVLISYRRKEFLR